MRMLNKSFMNTWEQSALLVFDYIQFNDDLIIIHY